MSTHRQLPNNMDIAPFQEKGRWYRAFIEKDESGNAKLTYKDAGLPNITPTGYGFTMEGQKDGKNFHLVSVSSNPGIGSGTAGEPAFYYPAIGINYTDAGSQYVVDFNKPETNVSLKINDTAATVSQTVNGLVQKNIDLSAVVDTGGGNGIIRQTSLVNLDEIFSTILNVNELFSGYLILTVSDTDYFLPCIGLDSDDRITSACGYVNVITMADAAFAVQKIYNTGMRFEIETHALSYADHSVSTKSEDLQPSTIIIAGSIFKLDPNNT